MKLQHILSISTNFHSILSRCRSERSWDTIAGGQEADQDDLCHFSFSTSAPATKFELIPEFQFAEIKLYSIHYLKASVDLNFFFFVCTHEVFTGAAGVTVLLDVAHFLQY